MNERRLSWEAVRAWKSRGAGARAITCSRRGGLELISECDGVRMVCVCVQVLDNSPAKKAGMEAYFDFLVSIDGVRLVGVLCLETVSGGRRGEGEREMRQ